MAGKRGAPMGNQNAKGRGHGAARVSSVGTVLLGGIGALGAGMWNSGHANHAATVRGRRYATGVHSASTAIAGGIVGSAVMPVVGTVVGAGVGAGLGAAVGYGGHRLGESFGNLRKKNTAQRKQTTNHPMYAGRAKGLAGTLGMRKLTPEAAAYGKSLQKQTGKKANMFTQSAFNAHMNRKK